MENYRNRGNSDRQDKNSRGYQPRQNNRNRYNNGNNNGNNNYRRNNDENYGNNGRNFTDNNRNQNSKNYQNNYENQRPQWGNRNRYHNNYDNHEYNRPQQRGNYTIDENGYRHKKYWDHSDRKRKSFEEASQREDDVLENDGRIRLNKFLANSGMCSRREADRLIKAGNVTVNGEVVTEMGIKVNITDEVRFNGLAIKPEHKRYIVLNKPKDYLTTLKDSNARNTVMELIEGACKERVYPVGRLDRNTTGVLLFTNDGELAKKLTHPSNEIQKIYHVTTDRPVNINDMQAIADGIQLEDGFINADEIAYVDEKNKREIGIRIHSGKNRIVRRIFEHFGYEVRKLDRVVFAGITKKSISRGHWRFLTEQEVGFLHMISDKSKKNTAE